MIQYWESKIDELILSRREIKELAIKVKVVKGSSKMFKIVTPEREGYFCTYLSPANIAYGVVCLPFFAIRYFPQ